MALPLISLPTQGDRIAGLAGPLLLLMLLPAGYAAVYLVRELRDPSWRLLSGIGLALLTRLVAAASTAYGVVEAQRWRKRATELESVLSV